MKLALLVLWMTSQTASDEGNLGSTTVEQPSHDDVTSGEGLIEEPALPMDNNTIPLAHHSSSTDLT